jgi:hypothetical protein
MMDNWVSCTASYVNWAIKSHKYLFENKIKELSEKQVNLS